MSAETTPASSREGQRPIRQAGSATWVSSRSQPAIGEADLFLGGDPQPVVDRLGAHGRGGRHTALHLGGMVPAGPQQQPGDPAA